MRLNEKNGLRVLLIHTHYQQYGGEDAVFEAERSLLNENGCTIQTLQSSNDEMFRQPRIQMAIQSIWNREAYRTTRNIISKMRPHVVHVHNVFHAMSPSVFHAIKAENVPSVLTLHNFRVACINGLLFRSGQICEKCVGRMPIAGIAHKCYRNSLAASVVAATSLAIHRMIRTWDRTISVFVALTNFSKEKFVEAGIPESRIAVKPNFLHPDPGAGEGGMGYALYVGRLSPEKGLDVLIDAWKEAGIDIPIKIVGTGPMVPQVTRTAEGHKSIQVLGEKSRGEVISLMKGASFLLLPSVVYENFPMTIVEAFATGLPVVASDLGAMASLVDHGRTGLRFRPGDATDLAEKVEWLLSHPQELDKMRKEARHEYEVKYTAERNYQLLMGIYERALEAAKKA